MGDAPLLLAIDQGTTSTRALIFDPLGNELARGQRELTQHFPHDGWVEHDAEEIWRAAEDVIQEALARAGRQGADLAAIGITNQRETTVVWDRQTGRPIHHAIVWQDRRTASQCRALARDGHEDMIRARTGLLLDPYFSASKIAWLLDNVSGARAAAEAGKLAFGTIDSFLIWRLTGGRVHATDATNASRTQLFDIHRQDWDDDLLALFRVPRAVLPEVRDCAADFGVTDVTIFGAEIPIRGVAGDQQAAAIGQACVRPGLVKSTYGTGCFLLRNTGTAAVASRNRLLTTVAYRLEGQTTYALEGSIFVAGAAMQWLRDGLELIEDAAESEALAASVPGTGGVHLVPAFVGLGAPHWDPDARGAVLGITRDTGIAHVVRAGLESACYQTRDLLEAMADDGVSPPAALRIDGGMVANNWLAQFLADILGVPVERPRQIETTALGAAYLAALGAGIYTSVEDVSAHWRADSQFDPVMPRPDREYLYAAWRNAVSRVLGYASGPWRGD